MMQLQNASHFDKADTRSLSLNETVTWVYPSIGIQPPPQGFIEEFAGCVPSNVDIANVCCPAVNGSFGQFDTYRGLNQTERSVFEDAFPNEVSTVNPLTGTFSPPGLQESNQPGSIWWCSMPYFPLSSDKLDGAGFEQKDNDLGYMPESLKNWITCFEENSSEEARQQNQAVYACGTMNVKTGGYLEGYNKAPASNRASTMGAPRLVMLLGFLGFAALCVM